MVYCFSEITLEVLGQEPVGAFMVRESTSKPGCYALSLRVPRDFQPSGIAHYLIMRTNKGYKIKVCIILTTRKPPSSFKITCIERIHQTRTAVCGLIVGKTNKNINVCCS